MKAIICDLDGTLCDHSHRKHLTKADSDEYNSRLHLDHPKDAVREILYRMAPHHPIILITGRSEQYREDTERWLIKYHICYDELHMRGICDMQSDVDVKRGIFAKIIGDSADVLFVLEDRDCVVDMWRSIGLTCLQVEHFEVNKGE